MKKLFLSFIFFMLSACDNKSDELLYMAANLGQTCGLKVAVDFANKGYGAEKEELLEKSDLCIRSALPDYTRHVHK